MSGRSVWMVWLADAGGATLAVRFAERLRASGLGVPPDTVIAYAQALAAVGLAQRELVYWAGRATLVRRPDDVTAYDAAFCRFWEGHGQFEGRQPSGLVTGTRLVEDGGDAGEGGDVGGVSDEQAVLQWSGVETLRHKDLAELTEIASGRRPTA